MAVQVEEKIYVWSVLWGSIVPKTKFSNLLLCIDQMISGIHSHLLGFIFPKENTQAAQFKIDIKKMCVVANLLGLQTLKIVKFRCRLMKQTEIARWNNFCIVLSCSYKTIKSNSVSPPLPKFWLHWRSKSLRVKLKSRCWYRKWKG